MRRGIPSGGISPRWIEAVREALETLMGMRGSRVTALPTLRSKQLMGAPTQGDFNALQTDLSAIHSKLNEVISRSDGTE